MGKFVGRVYKENVYIYFCFVDLNENVMVGVGLVLLDYE